MYDLKEDPFFDSTVPHSSPSYTLRVVVGVPQAEDELYDQLSLTLLPETEPLILGWHGACSSWVLHLPVESLQPTPRQL